MSHGQLDRGRKPMFTEGRCEFTPHPDLCKKTAKGNSSTPAVDQVTQRLRAALEMNIQDGRYVGRNRANSRSPMKQPDFGAVTPEKGISFRVGPASEIPSPSLAGLRTPVSKPTNQGGSTPKNSYLSDRSYSVAKNFKIPQLSFSGKGWKGFITRFETASDKLGWTAEEKLDAFSLAMVDDAAEYYGVLPDTKKTDYAWLRGKFDEYYEDLGPPSSLRWELLSVEQREDETLEKYMARLQKMIIRAYPESETRQLSNPMFVETFLKGCRDKNAALAACDKDPKSIEQAYKQVKVASQHRRAILGKKSSVRLAKHHQQSEAFASSDSDDVATSKHLCQVRGVNKIMSANGREKEESEHASLLKRLDSIESLVRGSLSASSSPGRFNSGCFQCGDPHHFIKDCPQKKARNNSSPGRKDGAYNKSPTQRDNNNRSPRGEYYKGGTNGPSNSPKSVLRKPGTPPKSTGVSFSPLNQ